MGKDLIYKFREKKMNTLHSNKSFFLKGLHQLGWRSTKGIKSLTSFLGHVRAGAPQLLGITPRANQALFFSVALFLGLFWISEPGKPMHKLIHSVTKSRIWSRARPFHWWRGDMNETDPPPPTLSRWTERSADEEPRRKPKEWRVQIWPSRRRPRIPPYER